MNLTCWINNWHCWCGVLKRRTQTESRVEFITRNCNRMLTVNIDSKIWHHHNIAESIKLIDLLANFVISVEFHLYLCWIVCKTLATTIPIVSCESKCPKSCLEYVLLMVIPYSKQCSQSGKNFVLSRFASFVCVDIFEWHQSNLLISSNERFIAPWVSFKLAWRANTCIAWK